MSCVNFIIVFFIVLLFFSLVFFYPQNVETYEERSKRKIIEGYEKKYKSISKEIKKALLKYLKKNETIDGQPLLHTKSEHRLGTKRLEKSKIYEQKNKSKGTYTVNKEDMFLCDVDTNHNNTLRHVIIHEFAHVINDTIGHDNKWRTLFEHLLDLCHRDGLFDHNIPLNLQNYCGGIYH